MSKFFGPYSPFSRFGAKLADLMILNLLFIVTSLPLVTLGATLTALNDTAMKIASDQYESVSLTYFASLKSNLKRGILLGLASAGLLVVAWAWYFVADHLNVSLWVGLALMAVVFLLAIRLIGTLLFVFPYQAMFDDTFVRVFNNARRLSARHPVATLTVFVTTVLPVVVTIFYPIAVGWGVLWLLVGFAGIAFVNATVFTRVFARYLPS